MGGRVFAWGLATLSLAHSAWGSANADCRRLLEGLRETYDADATYAQVFGPTQGEPPLVTAAREALEKRAKPLGKTASLRRDLLLRRFLEAADSPHLWLSSYENTKDPVTRRPPTPTERAFARSLVAYLDARFPRPKAAHYRRPFPAKPSPAEASLQKSLGRYRRRTVDSDDAAKSDRAFRYVGKKTFHGEAEFDAWVESREYRAFANEVSGLAAEELPWLEAKSLSAKAPLDLRTGLVDVGANHKGVFSARLGDEDVVLKRAPLATLAHEMRAYLILNKLGLGPTAYGLVELEPGVFAICLKRLPDGVDSKVVVRRARHGIEVVQRELAAARIAADEALVRQVRQVVLRMEAGGLGTAEDLQLRLGRDGSVEPFDLEGVARGVVHAYGQRLPSPVEAADPLLRVLEAVAARESRPQRALPFSKSR